jgi:hypothetical protein
MNNTITSTAVSDAVIKEQNVESSTQISRPSDKEIMDALIKQAKFAEDYYVKLLSEFQENLKKKYFNL